MPSFLSRSFSGKKKKESQKASESIGNPVPSSPSRFRILPSRSASRPPTSSSAVDAGSSKMRGLLSRTPVPSRAGSRGGESNQNAASKPLSPPSGAVDRGVVGSRVHDRSISSGNTKPSQLPVPISGPPPQRVNSPPNPQRSPFQADRPTSPFPPSRTSQQDYQQQLRKSTASPPIPSRGPFRGPSPYSYGPLQNHNQWPASFNPINNTENFSMVDLYSRQGSPALRNPSQNSTRTYPRSQSMTSELGHSPEGLGDGAPPSSRSFKGSHLESGEKRSSHNIGNSTNINSVMLENGGPGGPGGMRMGMGMVGLDGVLNPNIGTGNMQRRGGNVPPIPRIPSMYKPSAQSVRNQNQMMNSSNYSQCPPAFRNGKPRNSQGRLSPQFPDFEGPPHYAMGRGQPPRMQSPRPLQPPHRSHSTGLRGPDMGPPSQDRRALKGMNENVNGHPNSETALLPTPDNSSAEDSVNPSKKPDLQQPQQSTIPTALPTPSLTPTPPSRSNSNEDRQNSDAESMHDEASEIPNRSGPPSEANSERTYKPWQENGQNHGYFRRPPPYQRIDPHHHGVSPPSPISAPTTPITASSASSTYGNSNHVIAQQIQVSVPIMPGPVKEICYTKDINLVMEECMMGHGRTGRGSVMRRTANWQHQVGCMMCGGYGGPGREGGESGPTLAGKHWLWLCNWCALRVCADCRCTLAKEEDHLREKGGNVGTLKVDLRALREKILEEKRQEQGRNRAEAVKERLSGDKSEKLVEEKINNQQVGKETLRAKVELLPVGIKAQKTQNDLPKKVDVPRDNTTSKTINQSRTHSPASFAVQHDRFSARPVNTITQHSLVLSTSSEESSNFFVAAGSGVELNGSQKVIGPAVKVYNKKTGYPPRVSSRDLATETKIEPNVSNKEPILSSPQTAAEPKQAGVTVAPMPLPVQTSTKITGIPVTQQPQAATVGYTPTPAVPAKPKSPARDLGSVIVPPTVPPKSPSPSRHATISSLPPQSSSSMPPSPIAQVKSLIPTSSTLQAQSNTVKQKPLTPDSPSPAPAEKFFLPPLSFESEVGNKIDNIVGTREYTAPKAQATHAEEAYKHEMVGSSRKGGRRWYKGLFGGRK